MTTTDIDRKLTDQILSHWTKFGATGNPEMPNLPDSPAFEGSDQREMTFTDEAHATDTPEPVLCHIFGESIANR